MSDVWVLGVPDPEMARIEAVLNEEGSMVGYAVDASGKRVHTGSAYQAEGVVDWSGDPLPLFAATGGDDSVFQIECDGPVFKRDVGVVNDRTVPLNRVVVDHHRPGHPGYGKPPSDYLQAASIGQVLAALGRTPTDTDRLVAAADHCLAAAYAGHCPGVDPDALMDWRVRTRANFQGKDPEALIGQVRTTMARIRELSAAQGNPAIVDLTGEPEGTLAEGPEAAARLGLGIQARQTEKSGRHKTVAIGAIEPEVIRAWMAARKAEGREVYGDPERGLAGAYDA